VNNESLSISNAAMILHIPSGLASFYCLIAYRGQLDCLSLVYDLRRFVDVRCFLFSSSGIDSPRLSSSRASYMAPQEVLKDNGEILISHASLTPLGFSLCVAICNVATYLMGNIDSSSAEGLFPPLCACRQLSH